MSRGRRDIFRTSRITGIVLGAIILAWNLFLAWHSDTAQVLVTAALFGVAGAALLGVSLGGSKQARYRRIALLAVATLLLGTLFAVAG